MCYLVPSGFEGNHYSRAIATDLIAELLNIEKWDVDEISDRIFKRILGRKISRPIDQNTERELFIQYRQGDAKAREALVYANLRLVNSVARKFKPHKLTCNDIISEGLIGLLKAIDSFDIDSLYRFSSYAYRTIYYHIQHFLNTYNSSIGFPASVYSLRKRYLVFSDNYFQEYMCLPPDSEVAEALHITFYYARGIRLSLTKPVSFDHLCDYLGYDFVIDDLIDDIINSEPDSFDASLNYESLLSDIDQVLSKLTIREADIIRKSLGIGCHPYSLEELGDSYDITRERARQIREKAIRRLRGIASLPLKQYLTDNF
ncbi:MAG: sigma-70 family RNA polymerase sigma factor [Muribaculaceae bacterium]|nr:sigma-70 family RNA polymerase sigma factor [Muribaculaceae bacterium]